jgi:ATP-dependent Clp protease adaptor protein ClpS
MVEPVDALEQAMEPIRCEETEPAKGGEPTPQEPERAPQQPKSATAVKERPAPPKLDQLPPFKVLLHNDDVNEMGYVVRTLMELTPLDKGRSTEVTLEADSRGVALVLVTHKERAELYEQQFKSKMLTVTIEPAT